MPTRESRRTVFPMTDRIALERGRPETMSQDNRTSRAGSIIGCVDQAAENGAQSHHLEVRPADDACAHDARLAQTDHREADRGEIAERRDRLHSRLEVIDFRYRERRIRRGEARCTLADVDQTVFVAVGQRLEQHAAHHAEDRGIGPDAERQREHDGDRQAPGPQKRPQREPEISHETHRSSVLSDPAVLKTRRDMARGVAGPLNL